MPRPTPRYTIHIGPMKTASTYLQRCLHERSADLAARGIHYAPELTDPKAPHVHHPLYFAIRSRDPEGEMRRRIAALNEAGHADIVLTSEFLAGLGPPGIAFLSELIGPAEIRIVYMCRRWSDRLFSVWYNSVQTGKTETLPDMIGRFLGDPMRTREVNYVAIWRNWTNVFGRDCLHILPTSTIADAKEDIFVRFCADVLGVADLPPPARLGRRVNASGDGIEGELVRALNAISLGHDIEPRTSMLFGLWNHRKRAGLPELQTAMRAFETPCRLDDADPRLDRPYTALQRFADRLVLPDGAPRIAFERRARDVTIIDPAWLAQPGLSALLDDLYRSIAAAPQAAPADFPDILPPDGGESAA